MPSYQPCDGVKDPHGPFPFAQSDGLVPKGSTTFLDYKGDTFRDSVSHSVMIDFMVNRKKNDKILAFYPAVFDDPKTEDCNMTYQQMLDGFIQGRDEAYAAFSRKIANSDYDVIGIRNPILRKFAKDHKTDEELVLSDFVLGRYLEVDFVYFVLGLSRLKTIGEKLAFLRKDIHWARSWAITDGAVSSIKSIRFEDYRPFFLAMKDSHEIYDRRIAYVLGLKADKDTRILQILKDIRPNEDYMVMMGQAWLLSDLAISFPEEIHDYLANLDDWTLRRKTISKIQDSFRFDKATKESFRALRRE